MANPWEAAVNFSGEGEADVGAKNQQDFSAVIRQSATSKAAESKPDDDDPVGGEGLRSSVRQSRRRSVERNSSKEGENFPGAAELEAAAGAKK